MRARKAGDRCCDGRKAHERPGTAEQLTYALVTGFLGYIAAGRYYGLDAMVEKFEWVRATPQLKCVLG